MTDSQSTIRLESWLPVLLGLYVNVFEMYCELRHPGLEIGRHTDIFNQIWLGEDT